MFAENGISLASDYGDERLNGRTWNRVGDNEKQQFWDYVIPVEFLSFDTNDTKEVNQAFDRLNRNMRKLDRQELRHARWDGWFISLVEAECEDSVWRRLGIVTNARSKRMKDAQFISELLLVLIERKQLGFDQQLLDDTYSKYEDLDEADLPVNPDEIKEQLLDAKQYILALEASNGCVKEYATTLAVFYTLWAAVVLHRRSLPDAEQFAAIFAEFRKLSEAVDIANIAQLERHDGEKVRLASVFVLDTKGASTDLGPRTRRLEALLAFVAISKN
jgi:hypothetical protein